MRYILSYSCFILLLLAAKTPDTKKISEKFRKANENYAQLSNCVLEFEYNVFSGESKSPLEKTRCIIGKKSNTEFYQKMGGITIVQNSEVKVIVDDSNKVVLAAPPASVNGFQQIDADKSLKMASEIITVRDDAEETQFRMVFDKKSLADFKSIDIFIDNKTGLLKEMIVYYHPKIEFSSKGKTPMPGRLQMQLKSLKTGVSISAKDSSPGEYIKKSASGKWMSTSKYSSYQFIDQTK